MDPIKIMPCLDMKEGRVVKGIHFVDLRDAGDPVEQARVYDAAGADELCFLDITASHEERPIILDVDGDFGGGEQFDNLLDDLAGIPRSVVMAMLGDLCKKADVIVVSATPQEALQREWEEHDLTQYVVAICGQEIGTKAQSLGAAKNYPPGHTLMIGDAPGDHKAAKANDALFFPINPGAEEASWKRFYEEGIDRFLGGAFAGKYQEDLLTEFDSYLPEKPPWETE